MKREFRAAIAKRYSLRRHMMAMILAMVALGAVATSSLRDAGLESMGARYPVVVLVAYAGFLAFVWIWIRYFIMDRADHPPVPAAAVAAFAAMPPRREGESNVGDIAEAAGEVTDATVGGSFDLGDGEGAVVLIVIGIVVAVVMGLGAYAIWEAPAILGDAVFHAALGAAVQRSVSRADTDHWLNSIWRSTWWMLLTALVLALVAGWMLDWHCDGATTAIEALQCGG